MLTIQKSALRRARNLCAEAKGLGGAWRFKRTCIGQPASWEPAPPVRDVPTPEGVRAPRRLGVVERRPGETARSSDFFRRSHPLEKIMNLSFVRGAAWSLVAAIAFVTLCPIQSRPQLSTDPQAERLIAFLALGFVFGLAYPRHRAQVAVVGVVCAFALEAAQRLVAGRHGELRDVLAKTTGGLLGVLAADLAQRLTPRG